MQIRKVSDKQNQTDKLFSVADIENIADDPSKLESFVRAMGVVNLENLFKHMQDPTVNPATRIEFQKLLNKMGKLEPDTKSDTGGGPQVVINITRAKDHSESLTIEGTTVDASD